VLVAQQELFSSVREGKVCFAAAVDSSTAGQPHGKCHRAGANGLGLYHQGG